VPTATPTPLSEAEQLRDLLTDPGCEKACYLGIEPGRTTRSEAEAILNREQLAFIHIPLISEGAGMLSWPQNPSLTFLDHVYDATLGYNGQVTFQLNAGVNVPVATVIEAFGPPDKVLYGFVEPDFSLVYTRLNLVFLTSYEGKRITSLALALHDAPHINMVNSAGTAEVSQVCTNYGTPPCIVPTATPTPTIQPTNTPARES
jgi:hypothetical protein